MPNYNRISIAAIHYKINMKRRIQIYQICLEYMRIRGQIRFLGSPGGLSSTPGSRTPGYKPYTGRHFSTCAIFPSVSRAFILSERVA